jgi:hypothetical protein
MHVLGLAHAALWISHQASTVIPSTYEYSAATGKVSKQEAPNGMGAQDYAAFAGGGNPSVFSRWEKISRSSSPWKSFAGFWSGNKLTSAIHAPILHTMG